MDNIFKSFDEDKINEFRNSDQIKKIKEQYKDKSEEEMMRDAKNIGKQLKDKYGEEEFQKKVGELKKIEKFLNNDQKQKLKKILDSLN